MNDPNRLSRERDPLPLACPSDYSQLIDDCDSAAQEAMVAALLRVSICLHPIHFISDQADLAPRQ